MGSGSRYSEVKGQIPQIKALFQTRHYIQCVAQCERVLLTRAQHEIHPIHLAYLNFYLAMSHDTLAREASVLNRPSGLEIAEKHYLKAIAALTPRQAGKLGDIQEYSPTSTTSDDPSQTNGRRASDTASLDSELSIASSATSYAEAESENDCEPTPRTTDFKRPMWSQQNLVDSYVNPKRSKRRPSPIITVAPKFSQPPEQEQFVADVSSFVRMIERHLASVRELREASVVPMTRFSFSTSCPSTASSRPASRGSVNSVLDKDKLLASRKSMNFRPRFDPTSVQKLCCEVLSEL